MSQFIKTYPRAKVSRHPNLNGWVIDLIQRDGAKPKRVVATYSSILWADKAARLKLPARRANAVQPVTGPLPKPTPPAPHLASQPAGAHGTCIPCNRPMRPAGSKAADYPGTTLRQREGLCQSCNQRLLREGTPA